MRSVLRSRVTWVLAGLCAAGVAWASPWDIDMIQSTAYKPYKWQMMLPPEGSVRREGPSYTRAKGEGYYQNQSIPAIDRMKADSLTDPYAKDPKHLETGKKRFEVSCQPCHGIEGKGGGPVTQNDPSASPPRKRFQMPAPLLSGANAVTPKRSDGYIYGTIRNGGAVMPAYGHSLTDEERWAIVAYIRTLDGAAYDNPAAAAAGTPAFGGDGAGPALGSTPGTAAPAAGSAAPATSAPKPGGK